MSARRQAVAFAIVGIVLLSASPGVALAQSALRAEVLPQGSVRVALDGATLATLSLNAHGPEWKQADQPEATATVSSPGEDHKWVVQGTLPVPNTDGGAIRFVETVQPAANGFVADYVVGPTEALALNGLHVSLLLPVAAYAGKPVVVHALPAKVAGAAAPSATLQELVLPAQVDAAKWQLFTGAASKAEVAPGTAQAVTLLARAFEPTDEATPEPPVFAVQDLRRWEHDQIEVRLSLISSDAGRWLSPWDKLHVAVEVSFAQPLGWE